MTLGTRVVIGLGILGALTGLGLAGAPFVYAELSLRGWGESLFPESPIAVTGLPGPPLGEVMNGHWRVQRIAPDTWALGEPADAPDNYEYLLVGNARALLIDAGATTTHDLRPVLARLTSLPVTVLPTHLHFDHTNGLRFFNAMALIDLPSTRGRVRDGLVALGRYDFLDSRDPRPGLRVTEWVKPEATIDLGGRRVQLLWTPGHTETSTSIYDPGARLLFTGDFIYTTSLYAFMTDSSLAAYERSATRLLATLPADTTIYGAHCCRNDAPAQAPWLGMQDLRDVKTVVAKIEAGSASGERGLLLRRFPVNARITLVTFYPFGNR